MQPITGVPARILMPVLFLFLILTVGCTNTDAAAIICGDDSTTKATNEQPFKAPAIQETNEKSLPNEETADGTEAPLPSPSSAPYPSPLPTAQTTTETSDVKKFFKTVQCTLEKAKPWVEEIEKEAKRLEETAKRFSEGVINKLGDFMEKLIPSVDASATSSSTSTPTNNPTKSLFSSLLDSFGAVVAVVGGVAGNKTTPLSVAAPVEVVPEEVVTAATSTDPSLIEHADELDNQILDNSDVEQFKQVCPRGFMADINGVCQRVAY